jgi:folate-binding protein YgfZ
MLTEYYQAARRNAALAEKDWYGILKLEGSERASWLQGMVTNDVQKLAPGKGCYAAHLSPQGKIVAHMHILADVDALWFSLERAAIPRLVDAFDKLLIMEDVQISDLSDQFDILSVVGPRAGSVLESWAGEPLALLETYDHRRFEFGRVVLSDLGYDVWVPPEQSDKILRSLAQSGATAIDRGTWDVLRTEAGLPVYGLDIDETTIMSELGERGISYDKGCYVGQEVIAKVKYIGHVNRRFVGIQIAGTELPEPKNAVTRGGREVGYITTSLFSPALNSGIALGFVSRTAQAPGTEVEIESEGKKLAGTIVELPFVRGT